MAMRITLGQYYAANSPIHRMDPRAKTLCALAVMVTVFFIRMPSQLALGFAFALVCTWLARVPAVKVIESIKPAIFVLLVLGIFNLFVVGGGDLLWSWGPLAITTGGVQAAFIYSLRLIVGVMMGVLMLLTTTPSQLTDAFDSMLSPISRIGLPGHELAMVFSLMLRFIPTLADEAHAIMDAQKSRGGALGEGSPLRRVRAIVPVLVALLASSVHHANDLSRALDARCYEGGGGRSHWHALRMQQRDWIAVACTVAYIAVLLFLGTLT